MEYQNLRFLQESLLKTQGICSWSLTRSGQLLYTNAPEEEFFLRLLLESPAGLWEAMGEHFSEPGAPPLIAVDDIGLAWIAACQEGTEGEIPLLHLLGPVRSFEISAASLRLLPPSLQSEENQKRLRALPFLLSDAASRYASLLLASFSGRMVSPQEVQVWAPKAQAEDSGWTEASSHGTWEEEQRLFQCIMEGNTAGLRQAASGRIGQIGGGDPLRQAKNEIIILSVLCSRGAILGGVSSEGSYNLSDYYLNRIEEARTIEQVRGIGEEMFYAFMKRVQEAKKQKGESELVRVALEYIQTRLFEKISVREMAAEIGYSETHLSRSFKSQTGVSLTDMIARKKIEAARRILDDPSASVSIAELAGRLCYSSTSHFCAVFRKEMGISPSAYQNRKKEPRSVPNPEGK